MSMDEIIMLNVLEAMEEAEYLNSYRRQMNQRTSAFELSDHKFVQLFRLDKSMVDEIVDRIDPYMNEKKISWGLDTVDKVTNFQSTELLFIIMCEIGIYYRFWLRCDFSRPGLTNTILPAINTVL